MDKMSPNTQFFGEIFISLLKEEERNKKQDRVI